MEISNKCQWCNKGFEKIEEHKICDTCDSCNGYADGEHPCCGDCDQDVSPEDNHFETCPERCHDCMWAIKH